MLTLIILGAKSFRVINFVLVKNIIGNSSVIPTAYRETKRNDKELPSFNATFAELGTNAKHIDEIIEEIRLNPDFSLISTMLQGQLTREQINANIKLAISGGQNEPRDAIAGCIWAVLNFQLKGTLVQKTFLWHDVFDEYCRWMSPIGMSPREIKNDFKYKNINFHKGDRIFLMFLPLAVAISI